MSGNGALIDLATTLYLQNLELENDLAPEDAPNLFRGGGFRASSVHVRSADRYSIYAADYSAYDVGLRPARLIENLLNLLT